MSENRPIVYLVEDDQDVVSVLIDILEDKYEASGFNNSRELFAKLDQGLVPDVFLLDINLPFRSGIDILTNLREKGYNQPAILVSGYGNRGELVKSINLGVTAFVDKPIDFKELSAAIERLTTTAALRRNQKSQLQGFRDLSVPRSEKIRKLEAEESVLISKLAAISSQGL